MSHLNFNASPYAERHECNAYKNGEWIVYACAKCNYELRENWHTGELNVRNAKPDVHHSGSYSPSIYLEAFMNRN
jgi:hypothetical protein